MTDAERVRERIAAAVDALRAEGLVLWLEECDVSGKYVIELYTRRDAKTQQEIRNGGAGVAAKRGRPAGVQLVQPADQPRRPGAARPGAKRGPGRPHAE